MLLIKQHFHAVEIFLRFRRRNASLFKVIINNSQSDAKHQWSSHRWSSAWAEWFSFCVSHPLKQSLWHGHEKEWNSDGNSLSQRFYSLFRMGPRSIFQIHFTDEALTASTNIYGFKCLRSFSRFSFLASLFRCLLSSSYDAFEVLCCFSVCTYQTPLLDAVMRTWLFKFLWNFISSRAERLIVLCKH